jgi:hypothetical protein
MKDRSGGRVGQSDRVLSDGIKLHQAKRRPGTGEVRFTGAEHVRTKVQAILVNETRSGQHVRKLCASDVDVSLRQSRSNRLAQVWR